MEKRGLPRIMLAAPSSGSGKTMITCGLLSLLKRRMNPIAFKCGPDYIDPMFHEHILQIPSRNLDAFFSDQETMLTLMGNAAEREHADCAVIEGVMGYYDGLGGISLTGSSFELATKTQTPVILVVNGKGMSLSLVAMIKGYLSYKQPSMIKGVILNRISPMIYQRLKAVIESELPVQVLGYVPERDALKVPGRHLGLMMPEERKDFRQQLENLTDALETTIDVNGVLALAEAAPALTYRSIRAVVHEKPTIRIAVARDEAFCFYYQDNLDLLEQLGVKLVPFSPIHDQKLPDHISGIYMGGGYPELYGRQLSENIAMKQDIKQAIEKGMPCLAECGAFMYLHEEMEDINQHIWPMVGLVPGKVLKKDRLVRFGYLQLKSQQPTILGPAGLSMPAHEFHYWDTTCEETCFLAEKPLSDRKWTCMYQYKNLLTGFPHLYFYANREMAEYWVSFCRNRQEE